MKIEVDYYIVTTEEFPHGIRCAECHEEILPGQFYALRADSISEYGSTWEELVCVVCFG